MIGFLLAVSLVAVAAIVIVETLRSQRCVGHRCSMTRAVIKETVDALDINRLKLGKYPEKLDELIGGPLKAFPVDAWGHPLVYRKGGEGGRDYEVGSLGGDHQAGGTDEDADIWSYDLNAGSTR